MLRKESESIKSHVYFSFIGGKTSFGIQSMVSKEAI